jgi:hypothetical protein
MPIETTPEAEPLIVDDASFDDHPPERLPIFRTILAGYRIVAENLISFTAVTIFLAAVHFSLMKASPLLLGAAKLSMRDAVLQSLLGLVSIVCASIVFGIAGVRWYRRILLDERRQGFPWFGSREVQFAVCMLLFYFVLTVPTAITPSRWQEIGAYLLDQRMGYPVDLFGPTVGFLWHVVMVALLFFAFPAIALEIARPLEHGMRVARHAFPNLFLVYLIGLVPWFALDKLGMRALLFHIDTDRLFFVGIVLNMWITICTFALAGAAYREITQRELLNRLSIDFA